MAQINFGKREIICKIVFWGPGLSGKTTNLEVIHRRAPKSKTSELVSIATEGDRTLFFDYMPLDVGHVAGMQVKLQLYTVPGQAYYRATRELVLRGADGVVFVADSRAEAMEQNRESLDDLHETLRAHGLDPAEVPLVLQWNKRDMPGAVSVTALEKLLNPRGRPSYEAVAIKGEGVFPTLKKLAQLVLEKVNRDFTGDRTPRPPVQRPVERPVQRPRPPRKPAEVEHVPLAPERPDTSIPKLPATLRPKPPVTPPPRRRRWRLVALCGLLVAAMTAFAADHLC